VADRTRTVTEPTIVTKNARLLRTPTAGSVPQAEHDKDQVCLPLDSHMLRTTRRRPTPTAQRSDLSFVRVWESPFDDGDRKIDETLIKAIIRLDPSVQRARKLPARCVDRQRVAHHVAT